MEEVCRGKWGELAQRVSLIAQAHCGVYTDREHTSRLLVGVLALHGHSSDCPEAKSELAWHQIRKGPQREVMSPRSTKGLIVGTTDKSHLSLYYLFSFPFHKARGCGLIHVDSNPISLPAEKIGLQHTQHTDKIGDNTQVERGEV